MSASEKEIEREGERGERERGVRAEGRGLRKWKGRGGLRARLCARLWLGLCSLRSGVAMKQRVKPRLDWAI